MIDFASVLSENKLVLEGELKACYAKIDAVESVITNKKLVVYCLIALIIGAATIVPLGLFLMTQLDKEPQFNVNVSYAYVDNYWDNDTAKIQRNYGLVYAQLLFETTPRYNLRQFPFNIFPYAEAASEHYTIELLSEKGSIGNLSYYVSQYSQYALRSGFHFDITVFHTYLSKYGHCWKY